MANLHDFDLDPNQPSQPAAEAPPEPPPPEHRSTGFLPLMLVAIAVAAVIITVFWFLSRRVESPEGETPPSATPFASTEPQAREDGGFLPEESDSEVEPLPALAESDGFARELLRRLSSHASMARWLAPPYLVERFVATVENIAVGTNPTSHLGALAPTAGYRAVNHSGTFEPDPANELRFNAVADVFAAMDARACAAVYRRLRPLFQEAYADLGYPDSNFDDATADAIHTLLSTPIPTQAPALERSVASYRYVNPDLEALAAAQKGFLRTGSENMRKIKTQLQAVADALDLDVR